MTPFQPELIDLIDRTVHESLSRWGIPGAAIGIRNCGETFERAYGTSNLTSGQLVLPGTLFRVASISKPFTATLAMTLVDEGALDLDAPVSSYLPDLPLSDAYARSSLTMRHLLSHVGGFDGEYPGDMRRFGDSQDALRNLIGGFSDLRQWTAPGELWSYCNSGFWLAGAVIASITGMTFEDAMRSRVFEPLGLEETCYDAEEAILHPVALGHQPTTPGAIDHDLIRSYAYPRPRRPSGGVISSVGDLLRFADAHVEGAKSGLLSERSRRAMQEPIVRLRQSTPDHWGIGWEIVEADGMRFIGHGGSFGGFQSQLWIVPDRQFAFVILTNSSRGSAAFPAIERVLLPALVGRELPQPTTTTLQPDELERVAGRYAHGVASFTITVTNGQLRLVSRTRNEQTGGFEDAQPIDFTPITAHEFIALGGESEGSRLEFIGGDERAPRFVRAGLRIAERLD